MFTDERLPDHRHWNLKALEGRIQKHVYFWLHYRVIVIVCSGLGVRVVWKLFTRASPGKGTARTKQFSPLHSIPTLGGASTTSLCYSTEEDWQQARLPLASSCPENQEKTHSPYSTQAEQQGQLLRRSSSELMIILIMVILTMHILIINSKKTSDHR